jgi:hypothetical protein
MLSMVAVAAAAALAAWGVTGLSPFTIAAYTAVGLPVVALVAVVVGCSFGLGHSTVKPGPATLRSVFPWLVLTALGIGLEALGLVLGGRSVGVPTLSTVVDHTLAWHGLRFVLFCGWLAIGWVPALRWAFGPRCSQSSGAA